MTSRKRIVIIGGSYAGVRVARDTARSLPANEVEIVLISEDEYHHDIPEYYEIATAYLPGESTESTEHIDRGTGLLLTDIFARLPVTVRIGSVKEIDSANRLVMLADHTSLSFDFLVLAVGSPVAVFGIPGVFEHAFTIKTLSDALRLRHHIVRMVMEAPQLNASIQQSALRFVIIGAGATGVELAAELSGLIRHIERQRYAQPVRPSIMLLEAGKEILRELPDDLRHRVQERLHTLGVDLRLNMAVSAIEHNRVILKSGEEIAARTIIWSGGLRPHDLLTRSHLPIAARGAAVDASLRVNGQTAVFAVGDCAVITDSKEPIPATVPVAYSQAMLVSRNLAHALRSEPLEHYSYRPRVQIITLGGTEALIVLPSKRGMIGRGAWVLKQVVMLRYWAWYVSWTRSLALLLTRLSVQIRND